MTDLRAIVDTLLLIEALDVLEDQLQSAAEIGETSTDTVYFDTLRRNVCAAASAANLRNLIDDFQEARADLRDERIGRASSEAYFQDKIAVLGAALQNEHRLEGEILILKARIAEARKVIKQFTSVNGFPRNGIIHFTFSEGPMLDAAHDWLMSP